VCNFRATLFNEMIFKNRTSIEYVLFDWDGTLLNSFEADANAYMHMFGALGMSWSVAELKRHYSPNWHRVYRAARLPRAKWEEADRLWGYFYRKQKPKLQKGALRVLRIVDRRFKLALVSSGSRARVRRQLREEIAARPLGRAKSSCQIELASSTFEANVCLNCNHL